MKKLNFFAKFLSSMSVGRKVHWLIGLAGSIVLSLSIAIVWWHGGCEFRICLTGALFGLIAPLAIWSCIDDAIFNNK